jgi:hypothetical protein
MPMVQHVVGGIYDSDWSAPAQLESLSHSATRWNDGQQVNLEADYKYSDCIWGMPIEFWPLAGFRWEKFSMTAYDGVQLFGGRLGPFSIQGDDLTINQQYYTGYIGFQLRKCIERECKSPINLVFQFDWGATGAYMVDHHLIRFDIPNSNFYNMQSTGGDTIHLALSGDVPINCHLSLGLRADYQRIRTTGSMVQIQDTRVFTDFDCVLVKSEQTDITAYLQYTF